jgi:uncharacterized membrane protein YdjX (TVP38/TMEM64 family)
MTELHDFHSNEHEINRLGDRNQASPSRRHPARPQWQKRLRWWGLGAIALALAYPAYGELLPLLWDPRQLELLIAQWGAWGIGLFIGLHILATTLGIPGVILTMVGGVIFGVTQGTLWTLIGATLGALGAFSVARYVLHDWCDRWFQRHPFLQRVNHMVRSRPLWAVMAVRFAPISPFNLVNFLFGLTRIHPWPYTLGTFVGIIPGVIVYNWLGMSGYQALHGENLFSFLGAGLALAVLSAVPLLVSRRTKA